MAVDIDLSGDAVAVAAMTKTLSGDAVAVAAMTKTLSGDAVAVDAMSKTLSGDAAASPWSLINLHGDAVAVSGKQTFDIDLSGDALAVHPEVIPNNVPNPQRVCDALKKCLPCNDDPIQNLSSEDPDSDVFCATATYRNPMPLLGQCGGQGGQDLACTQFCCSEISQDDAQICALRKAEQCVLES